MRNPPGLRIANFGYFVHLLANKLDYGDIFLRFLVCITSFWGVVFSKKIAYFVAEYFGDCKITY